MTAKQNASDFFDSYAHDFDAIYGHKNSFINRLINYFFRKSMRLRYRKTIEGCLPVEGRTALDVGCGPGHYCIALARRGIGEVWGIDFAPAMIELAQQKAKAAGVNERCRFITGDYLVYKFDRIFDYCVLTGFMDYIADPERVIDKTLSLTSSKAFFSFPAAEGFLAWQRRVRYKKKCDLYMYNREGIEKLFLGKSCRDIKIEKISRDYFVTVLME
jgi:2-polyprenyl-3-methyl-5-hydroxy-6-metoxy-1,4-benzoquinol methylase